MTQLASLASDESPRTAILATFAADARIVADLRVGVLNGIARLAGTVDSLPERAAAEALARHMASARGVVNRIEAPGAPSPAREINLDFKNEKQSSQR